MAPKDPRRTLAVTRQALPRGAATARAQVWDTSVPLLQYTDTKDVGGLIHEHLWDRRTESLSVRRGWRSCKERIEAKHTSGLPRFGPHGCVKPYSCFVVCIEFLLGSAQCYSTPQQLTRPSVSVLFLSPMLRMGLLLYAQGVTDRWQRRQG